MKKLKLIVNNNIKKKEKTIFFVKTELQSILNLYSRMVSNGTWKDYSLSSGSNNEYLIKGSKINKIDILFNKIEKNND